MMRESFSATLALYWEGRSVWTLMRYDIDIWIISYSYNTYIVTVSGRSVSRGPVYQQTRTLWVSVWPGLPAGPRHQHVPGPGRVRGGQRGLRPGVRQHRGRPGVQVWEMQWDIDFERCNESFANKSRVTWVGVRSLVIMSRVTCHVCGCVGLRDIMRPPQYWEILN